jgi:hypothetical protein
MSKNGQVIADVADHPFLILLPGNIAQGELSMQNVAVRKYRTKNKSTP